MHELDAERLANVKLRQQVAEMAEVAKAAKVSVEKANATSDKWRKRWEQNRMYTEDLEANNRRWATALCHGHVFTSLLTGCARVPSAKPPPPQRHHHRHAEYCCQQITT